MIQNYFSVNFVPNYSVSPIIALLILISMIGFVWILKPSQNFLIFIFLIISAIMVFSNKIIVIGGGTDNINLYAGWATIIGLIIILSFLNKKK